MKKPFVVQGWSLSRMYNIVRPRAPRQPAKTNVIKYPKNDERVPFAANSAGFSYDKSIRMGPTSVFPCTPTLEMSSKMDAKRGQLFWTKPGDMTRRWYNMISDYTQSKICYFRDILKVDAKTQEKKVMKTSVLSIFGTTNNPLDSILSLAARFEKSTELINRYVTTVAMQFWMCVRGRFARYTPKNGFRHDYPTHVFMIYPARDFKFDKDDDRSVRAYLDQYMAGYRPDDKERKHYMGKRARNVTDIAYMSASYAEFAYIVAAVVWRKAGSSIQEAHNTANEFVKNQIKMNAMLGFASKRCKQVPVKGWVEMFNESLCTIRPNGAKKNTVSKKLNRWYPQMEWDSYRYYPPVMKKSTGDEYSGTMDIPVNAFPIFMTHLSYSSTRPIVDMKWKSVSDTYIDGVVVIMYPILYQLYLISPRSTRERMMRRTRQISAEFLNKLRKMALSKESDDEDTKELVPWHMLTVDMRIAAIKRQFGSLRSLDTLSKAQLIYLKRVLKNYTPSIDDYINYIGHGDVHPIQARYTHAATKETLTVMAPQKMAYGRIVSYASDLCYLPAELWRYVNMRHIAIIGKRHGHVQSIQSADLYKHYDLCYERIDRHTLHIERTHTKPRLEIIVSFAGRVPRIIKRSVHSKNDITWHELMSLRRLDALFPLSVSKWKASVYATDNYLLYLDMSRVIPYEPMLIATWLHTLNAVTDYTEVKDTIQGIRAHRTVNLKWMGILCRRHRKIIKNRGKKLLGGKIASAIMNSKDVREYMSPSGATRFNDIWTPSAVDIVLACGKTTFVRYIDDDSETVPVDDPSPYTKIVKHALHTMALPATLPCNIAVTNDTMKFRPMPNEASGKRPVMLRTYILRLLQWVTLNLIVPLHESQQYVLPVPVVQPPLKTVSRDTKVRQKKRALGLIKAIAQQTAKKIRLVSRSKPMKDIIPTLTDDDAKGMNPTEIAIFNMSRSKPTHPLSHGRHVAMIRSMLTSYATVLGIVPYEALKQCLVLASVVPCPHHELRAIIKRLASSNKDFANAWKKTTSYKDPIQQTSLVYFKQ